MPSPNRRIILAVLALLPFAITQAQSSTLPPDPTREARLAWWHEAKFGMFIHWGLYALPAGEWKGKYYAGIGEWIMYKARIPIADYEQLARQFNPGRFDAEA